MKSKMKSRVLAIIIAVAMTIAMVPQVVMADAQEGGSLSDTLSWKVEEGVLTISGTGDMPDYEYDYDMNPNVYNLPWFGLTFNKIVVEEGVTGIGNHAFAGLGDVHEAVLPSTLKKIGRAAFHQCGYKGDETTYLKVDLPDGLESMGESAFGNSGVESVRFPDSLKVIPDHAFSGCPLKEVVFGEQEVISAFAFYGCGNIMEVKLPPTLKVMGGVALAHAAIEELILPDGLKTLGSEWKSEDGETGEYPGIAEMPSLKRIVIPASLEKIYGAEGLFGGCEGLSVIAYKGTKEQWEELSKGLDPEFLPENMEIIYNYIDENDVIDITDKKVVLSATKYTYNGKVKKPAIKTVDGMALTDGTDYTVKIVNSKGDIITSPKNAGTYTLHLTGTGKYTGMTKASYTINKAANPLKVKGKTAKVKYKKLKKKTQTLKVSKVIKFTKKGQGKKSYKKSSVTYTKAKSVKMSKKALKKYKKKVTKKIKINTKTGKVTVKKGLKKGTYKVKAKVKAAGNNNYKASKWKTVTFRIKVK